MVSLNASMVPLVVTGLLFLGDSAARDRGVGYTGRYLAANAAISDAPEPDPLAPEPSKAATTIAKSPDGMFYVSATINKTKTRFLVDTGANLVVLTPNDARRIGLSLGKARVPGNLETAAGHANMERITLDHILVAGQDVYDVDAAVIQSGLKVSLMGQNLLSQLGPITISGNEMTVGSPR